MLFRNIVFILTMVALTLPAGFPYSAFGETSQRVVVNELLWMGSAASSSDEWIELRNMTNEAVDVSGWKMTRRSSGQEVAMLSIPLGKSIEPMGYFLISNFPIGASTHLSVPPDLVDAAVSLLNSGLEVKLYDSSGNLVDVADDGSGVPLAGKYESGKTYASMARNGVPGDGTKAERWHTSATSTNLVAGSPVLGTPRAANDNVPPTVPAIGNVETSVSTIVTFDASDASDPDGDGLTYAWQFGDGGTSDAVSPTHAYGAAGTYAGSLMVSDGKDQALASFTVVVAFQQTSETPIPTGESSQSAGIPTLNELFPNPEGTDDDEFIELTAKDNSVDLSGWSVNDEAGTKYAFPKGTMLQKDAFLVLWRKESGIALNNNGDSFQLRKSDGTVAQEVKYSESEEGASFSWNGKEWTWTTKPTPGGMNEIIKPNHAPTAKFSVSSKRRVGEEISFDASDALDPDGDPLTYAWDFGDGAKGTGKIVKHVYGTEGKITMRLTVRDAGKLEESEERDLTIRLALKGSTAAKTKASGTVKGASTVSTVPEAQQAESSTKVAIGGWVTAAPNALGDGILYLTDGTNGISVHSSAPLPKLNIGDGIDVRGVRRTKYGEAYILAESGGIVSNATKKDLVPRVVEAENVEAGDIGSFVSMTGDVTELNGSRFSVDDGTGEIGVYVRSSTNIKRPALRAGDRVTVVGILSKTSGGTRLLPRIKDDIIIVSLAVQPKEQNIAVPQKQKPSVWMYIFVAMAVVAGTGVGLWRKHKIPAV